MTFFTDRKIGTVHFPITDLVAHPAKRGDPFDLGPHFNWIYEPPLVKGSHLCYF